MPQEIDDFTILLPQSINMDACDLKVYSGLDRLWRMVARYTMAFPLTITVVDNKAEHVRSILRRSRSSDRMETEGWNTAGPGR